MTEIRAIQPSRLAQGLPGLSPVAGAAFMEACMVCLASQKHQSGVELRVSGAFQDVFRVEWDTPVTEQMRRTWADTEEATEAAACGLSFLLMLELTPYTVVERSRRGTGFDYWLDDRDSKFLKRSARMEISGILTATRETSIDYRVNQKIKQVESANYSKLPAYISVVEFSRPVARIAILYGHSTGNTSEGDDAG